MFLFIPWAGPDERLAGESFSQFGREVLALLGRREVLIAPLILISPCSSFALTNLLGGLGGDFHASARVLSLASGVGAFFPGLISSCSFRSSRAMESLVDRNRCRAIGLSDISLNELLPIYESARIKPAVVQVESHPYLPETELLEFCKENGVLFLAFAPLGHGIRPGPLEGPVISTIAARLGKTPAQVLLAWAVRRGTALLTTQNCGSSTRKFRHFRPSGRRISRNQSHSE